MGKIDGIVRNWMKDTMQRNGITSIRALSRMLGMNHVTLTSMLNGTTEIKFNVFYQFCMSQSIDPVEAMKEIIQEERKDEKK